MKKWVKGILALSIIAGIGFGGNYLWSKTNHSRLDDSSIEADADVQPLTRIYFEPKNEKGEEIGYNGALSIRLTDIGVSENVAVTKRYSELLDMFEKKGGYDYRRLFKNIGAKSAPNNELFGKKFAEGIKVSGMHEQFHLDNSNLNGYTLDESKFKDNLKNMVQQEEGKNYASVTVPYKTNDVEVTVKLSEKSKLKEPTVLKEYRTYGATGLTTSLKYSELESYAEDFVKKGYVLSQDSITFADDGEGQQEITVWLIAPDVKNKQRIIYEVANLGDDPLPSELTEQLIEGYAGSTEEVVHPSDVKGFSLAEGQPEKSTITFKAEPGQEEAPITIQYVKDTPGPSGGNEGTGTDGGPDVSGGGGSTEPDNTDKEDNQDVDKNTGNNNNNNTNNVTKSVTPFKVYGKQKLYRYSHANFTNKRRVQAHAKKVRAHAPVFTVVGKTTASNGAARYKLSDGTHITASDKYVGKLYWNGSYKKLHVTNPKGINTYKTNALSGKVKHVKQGATVAVKQISKKNGMTRYQLANGKYISGSKKLVSPTKPKQVKKVKAKTTVRLYKDVDLKKVVKTYKKGSVINVKGWDHSHGNVHHVSGYKRYKVAGGYITANSKYVKIAQ